MPSKDRQHDLPLLELWMLGVKGFHDGHHPFMQMEGSSGNRPPHLEIKDREAKVRTKKWKYLVGVLAISLFLEINGRGRNSDL